jgi:RNA polymerase sigma-70 factor (ECF subfamily)
VGIDIAPEPTGRATARTPPSGTMRLPGSSMNPAWSSGIEWSNAQEEARIGPPIDRSLIDRARTGDLDAFESIVRARMDAVYRLTAAILGDDADAADASQETFVAAWRELPRLRDADRFEAWLQRIAVNAARQTLRGRRRRRVREIPSSLATDQSRSPSPAAEVPTDAAVLDSAMAHLSVDQRSILVLHHLEGQSVTEIAAVLSIPVGTAKSRLFAARRALANAIAREEAE